MSRKDAHAFAASLAATLMVSIVVFQAGDGTFGAVPADEIDGDEVQVLVEIETLARAMTIIETAKLNGLDPQTYLADVLDRIHDHRINRLDELLPWNWAPMATDQAAAA